MESEKLVMQVTLSFEQFGELYRDLRAMNSARQRVNRLLLLAYAGWLLEKGRAVAPSQRVEAAPQRLELLPVKDDVVRVDAMLDDWGGDA